MKVIDTESFLSALCELIEDEKTVSTVVTGGSMLPFLSGGRDYVYLEKPRRNLRKGDIVLFKRTNGAYVLHRIKRIKGENFYLIGDRQYEVEGPVRREQILALAIGAKRKSKDVTTKSPVWLFYSKIWINMVSLRPFVFRCTELLFKNKKS